MPRQDAFEQLQQTSRHDVAEQRVRLGGAVRGEHTAQLAEVALEDEDERLRDLLAVVLVVWRKRPTVYVGQQHDDDVEGARTVDVADQGDLDEVRNDDVQQFRRRRETIDEQRQDQVGDGRVVGDRRDARQQHQQRLIGGGRRCLVVASVRRQQQQRRIEAEDELARDRIGEGALCVVAQFGLEDGAHGQGDILVQRLIFAMADDRLVHEQVFEAVDGGGGQHGRGRCCGGGDQVGDAAEHDAEQLEIATARCGRMPLPAVLVDDRQRRRLLRRRQRATAATYRRTQHHDHAMQDGFAQ